MLTVRDEETDMAISTWLLMLIKNIKENTIQDYQGILTTLPTVEQFNTIST